ncbi:hypothetical protein EZS27_007582 [termite gut metagenome]|uniref:Uncharacterized protein n=1 Tax=termite gut metagenome TaxID=433724 RepID=A0A5J4SHK2_9ZZZZ
MNLSGTIKKLIKYTYMHITVHCIRFYVYIRFLKPSSILYIMSKNGCYK